jgi:hypothetical protein
MYGEDKTDEVRERFDRDFLPKYGALWRKMMETQQTRQKAPTTGMNFLDAIEKKSVLSFNVPTHENGCDSDCGCTPPILEWEESVEPSTPSSSNSSEESSARPSWNESPQPGQDYSITLPEATTPLPDAFEAGFGRMSIGAQSDGFRPVEESKEIHNTDYELPRAASPMDHGKSGTHSPSEDGADHAEESHEDQRAPYLDAEAEEVGDLEEKEEDEEEDDESHSSGSTAINFDISYVVHSSPEKERNLTSVRRFSPPPKEEALLSPESSPRLSPGDSYHAAKMEPEHDANASLDQGFTNDFDHGSQSRARQENDEIHNGIESPRAASPLDHGHHGAHSPSEDDPGQAKESDEDQTGPYLDAEAEEAGDQEKEEDEEEDEEGDESHSSGSTAINFDISYVVHSSPEKERNTKSGRRCSPPPEEESLLSPESSPQLSPGDSYHAGKMEPEHDAKASLDQDFTNDFDHGSQSRVRFDHAEIRTGSEIPRAASPLDHGNYGAHSPGEDNAGQAEESEEAGDVEEEEENEEDEVDDESHSSGSTAINFDISYVVHSSPEKERNPTLVRPSSTSPMEEALLSPELSPRLSPGDSSLREGKMEPEQDSEENEADNGDDDSSASSGSTVHRFDLSHIVQSSPEVATASKRPKSKSLRSSERSEEESNDADASQKSDSTEFFDFPGDNQRSLEDASKPSTPKSPKISFPSPKKSPGLSPRESETQKVTSSSRQSISLLSPETNPRLSPRDSNNSEAQSFSRALDTPQQNTSKQRTSMLNGSVLIDLVDSDSSDDDNKESESKENFSPNTYVPMSRDTSKVSQPRNRAAASPNNSKDDASEWNEKSTNTDTRRPRRTNRAFKNNRLDEVTFSSDDEEWKGESSSEGSFESPSESENDANENSRVAGLFKGSRKMRILNDSDNDRMGESFDGDRENRDPNKRATKRKTGKKTGMTKAAFKKNKELLTKQLFVKFDQAAFDGRLSSVEVTWSNKLRTTAGLTRLKKSYTDMRPGSPKRRFASIELSTKVLDDPERLGSTLLHEMVHAAAWIIDGVSKPPHGACFKKWASVSMKRIPGMVVTTTHDYEIQYKYAWVSFEKVHACTWSIVGSLLTLVFIARRLALLQGALSL